ncbi:MFS transporter [Spiribacter halobius]|uniref:MFS transporter n=1 Tax=Sediminicurvatus halobius TaxID=2182432 RepID=A0A2U2N0X9_9GAMM|nr:MFS transporter [Spiribacter halobius]PWG62722.1 MFS transporter [Spiribacter halobius]UEX77391.1 MFS transporter [Spiribacter halobius]
MEARLRLLFLNVGHAYDHWFMLIFATAVIAMEREFGLAYGELMTLATPAFLIFGFGAIPAGWLGDRWSREGMMVVFFLGIGAACLLMGFADGPVAMATALFVVGVFAAIYHPVGIAMVAESGPRTSLGRRLGINGVWGNMGVAGAALVSAALVDTAGWRAAFVLPGVLSLLTGLAYIAFLWRHGGAPRARIHTAASERMRPGWPRVLAVVAVATIMVSLQFNATTVAMPKVLEERLVAVITSTAGIGLVATVIYATAAFAQIAVGMALDRFPVRPLLMAIAAGQVLAMSVAALSHGWPMVFAGGLVMVLVFAQVPIGSTLVARYVPQHIRARVYGLQFLLVLGVGGIAVPLVGALHGLGGFFAMFVALAVTGAVTALAGAAMPRPGEEVAAPA